MQNTRSRYEGRQALVLIIRELGFSSLLVYSVVKAQRDNFLIFKPVIVVVNLIAHCDDRDKQYHPTLIVQSCSHAVLTMCLEKRTHNFTGIY